MAKWNQRSEADRYNARVSNVFTSRGNLTDLAGYFFSGYGPVSFMVGGGSAAERYAPLMRFLQEVIGRMPVIVLHGQSRLLEDHICQAWGLLPEQERPPLWITNSNRPYFEPFVGMSVGQLISTVRRLGQTLGYTAQPRLERVVRAHAEVLRQLQIPLSLTGLSYLCSFVDMGELHANVMELPCGQDTARRIWADMGADADDGQFDLFRTAVQNLEKDASRSGWIADEQISEYNIITAMQRRAVLTVSVDRYYTEQMLPYLLEELKIAGGQQFVLLIDGLQIRDEAFLEYLCAPSASCVRGYLSDNVLELTGGDENQFLRLAGGVSSFVFFKHSTGRTATVLSEVFGRYEHTKISTTQGTNRGAYQIFARGRHDDVQYTTENRYRVMPEELMALGQRQAIVFDTQTDQIIHFN